MKKSIVLAAALVALATQLCACQKEPLPVPDYPLSAATIDAAMQEWGLTCTFKEQENLREEHQHQSAYDLRNAEDDRYVGFVYTRVRSEEEGETRELLIIFPRFIPLFIHRPDQSHAIPLEEAEAALAFAVTLFGGFVEPDALYSTFVQEYDTVNTVKQHRDVPVHSTVAEWRSIWTTVIDGITCQIELEQPRPGSGEEKKEYISIIRLVSDWEMLYPERPNPATTQQAGDMHVNPS